MGPAGADATSAQEESGARDGDGRGERVKVRVAGVQPRSSMGPGEERHVAEALEWLDRAAEVGADLVVFPEGYPGPANPDHDYDAMTPLAGRAAHHGVHVVASRIEPAGEGRH